MDTADLGAGEWRCTPVRVHRREAPRPAMSGRTVRGWYAEDAGFPLPNGRQFAGIETIRELYAAHLLPAARFQRRFPAAGNHSIAVEIEARRPDGTVRHTTNFHYLNAQAQIQRLSVYSKTP
ncbi:MAG: hypothetical protein QM661_12895 [Solimonas sp.]